ncbi:hypothetical protein R1sor_005478 [Riccia sorocarpa]|uniref:CCHC-type domain-containing protein n=1 Tax=Riccia sorocarpa TaxID=122646 RepID=A0ABD3HN69_9MARC
MSADRDLVENIVSTHRISSKRVSDRRLSILRRSAEAGDFIKRRKDLQVGNMSSRSRGRVDGSAVGQSDGGHSHTPRESTRRDLFGDQGASHTGSRSARMIVNQIFESSPKGAAPVHQRTWESGTQSYVRAVSGPSQEILNQKDSSGDSRATGSARRRSTHHPVQLLPVADSQTKPDDLAGASLSSGNPSSSSQAPQRTPAADDVIILEEASEVEVDTEAEGFDLSERDGEKIQDEAYNQTRKWKKRVMKEVTDAFKLLPDLAEEVETEAIEVEHTFDFAAQTRIQFQKRRGEDYGIVFCTVDMSPSRDLFTQWLYQEVKNKTAVQTTHVKVLAPKHYLVLTRTTEDRDLVLAGGPYYMKRRMVYTTPWCPGFDTSKIISKQMACWLDLVNVDHCLEGEAENLLSSIGKVLQTAGKTEEGDSKFQNIRGCVLMDMSKPLPTVLRLKLNGVSRRISIKYDTLPDACYICQERGHFARSCPQKNQSVNGAGGGGNAEPNPDEFITVGAKGRRASVPQTGSREPSTSNPYDPLNDCNGDSDPHNCTQPQNPPSQPVPIPAPQSVNTDTGGGAAATIDPNEANTQQGSENESEMKGEGEDIPDLNTAPADAAETPASKQLERNRRKEKKKERKLAARRAREELIRQQIEFTKKLKAERAAARGGKHTSDEEEDSEGDGFWQKPTDKKAKGNDGTMDTRGAKVVVDYSMSDRGGAALIIHPSVTVTEVGVKGNGTLAWAQISVGEKDFRVASIYGPHPREEKLQFFNDLKALTERDRWMLVGDWNMVLSPQDSAGPTALLKGEALEVWQDLDQGIDLMDMYNVAEERRGPRFTRQVYRGGRLDQARLDRLYFSQNGEWVYKARRLSHDGQEALSDHIPIIAELEIVRTHQRRRKKRETYLKMDVDSLKNPERREVAKEAWLGGWALSEDPVLAWELAWGRLREVFKEFRQQDREKISNLKRQQEDLNEMRLLMETGGSEQDRQNYSELEKAVQEAEILEANILRRRSRVKWVNDGEASTKYFFACLQAKQAQERLTELEVEGGELITDEDKVLEEVHRFYSLLYQQPPVPVNTKIERSEAMKLITDTVEAEENASLVGTPDSEEIERTVTGLAKNKAPVLKAARAEADGRMNTKTGTSQRTRGIQTLNELSRMIEILNVTQFAQRSQSPRSDRLLRPRALSPESQEDLLSNLAEQLRRNAISQDPGVPTVIEEGIAN